ncbi:hypothetical protein ANO14919_097790 [Xylariales sp. No.14919]|nr:hypothetical protein ANO14919_097790 [Xylariales sp. No.14919]
MDHEQPEDYRLQYDTQEDDWQAKYRNGYVNETRGGQK